MSTNDPFATPAGDQPPTAPPGPPTAPPAPPAAAPYAVPPAAPPVAPAYGYQQQPYATAAMPYGSVQPQRTSGMAIGSLITGIIGLSLVAIILGFIALPQIRRDNLGGRGMAIAGIILGFVWIALSFLFLAVLRDNIDSLR